jgi:predicted cupin superfamily sugar epimerase
MVTPPEIIELLGLQPLPVEGGYFGETYRAAETLPATTLPERYGASPRSLGTAIYYFLHAGHVSSLHRLRTDEVYHFYLGRTVELLLLYPDGSAETRRLGTDLAAGERPQSVVPAGVWQGLRLAEAAPDGFALLGTTMAPGFDPDDFELGSRSPLLTSYPQSAAQILILTPTEHTEEGEL